MDDSRNFLEQFIDCYQTKRCLWDSGSQEYLNKETKCEAYEDMLQIMRIYKANADVADVKKKINILRSSYRRELKKIRQSVTSGEGSESVYEPNLWWFHKLDFLKNLEKPLEIIPMTLKMGLGASMTEEETDSFQESFVPRKKFKKNDVLEVVKPRLMYECPSAQEDEYDHYSKAWAVKLRQMEWTQRLLAERLINEVIYQGQRGYLSDDIMTRLNNFSSNMYSASTTQPDREIEFPRTEVITNEEEEGDFVAIKSEPGNEFDNDFSTNSPHEATSSNSTHVSAPNYSKPPLLRPIRTSAPNNRISSSRTESLLEQFFKD